MNAKIFLALIMTISFASAHGQSKLRYSATAQAGLVYGSSEPGWQVQMINGVRFKTYSAGIGVGVDSYRYKTAPLFIDLRKNIFDRDQTPFIYADLGTNIPFDKKESNQWVLTEINKGGYYDVGVGYDWSMKNKLGFTMSLGYTHKYLHLVETYWWRTENNKEYIDYTLRRISFKAGLRF